MDKQKDNLEKFFQSKLQNFTEEHDGWNNPPESIWESARESFPVRKKKNRKPLFFILFIVGLSLGIFGIIKYNSEITKVTVTNHIVKSENKNVNKEIDKLDNNKIKNKLESSAKKLSSGQNVIETKEDKKPYNSINEKDKNINFPKVIKSKDIINEQLIVSLQKEKIIETNREEIQNSEINFKKNENINERDFIKNKDSSQFSSISKINVKQFGLLESNKLSINIKNTFYKKTLTNKKWDWEFGISHVRFIKNQIELEEEEETEPGKLAEITANYNNLNFNIARNLNKKWSLESGLFYTQLNGFYDVKFGSYFIEGNSKLQLRNNLSGFSSASVSLNEKPQNLVINYKKDVDLKNGTPVDFRFRISLEVRSLEIPIRLMHHWKYKRYDLSLGGGISLNYLNLKLNPILLKVYHNETLINIPVESESVNYSEFNWNFNTFISLKYKINKSFKIGTYLFLDPYEINSVRLGLGVYYRI